MSRKASRDTKPAKPWGSWVTTVFPHHLFPFIPEPFLNQLCVKADECYRKLKKHLPSTPSENKKEPYSSGSTWLLAVLFFSCSSFGKKYVLTNKLRYFIWKNVLWLVWNAGGFPASQFSNEQWSSGLVFLKTYATFMWLTDKTKQCMITNYRYAQYSCLLFLSHGPWHGILLEATRIQAANLDFKHRTQC